MNNLTKNNKELLTRTGRAIVSLILCIVMTGSLVCLPAFAAQPVSSPEITEAFANSYTGNSELTLLTSSDSTAVEIDRTGDTTFVVFKDLSDTSLRNFKAYFSNRESQIKVFRNGVELGDNDFVGTDCTVNCVSSDNSSVIHETAKAVVPCDVTGDGAFNESDIDVLMNKAVLGIDGSLVDGSAYFKAADCCEDGVIDAFDISKTDVAIAKSKYNSFTTVFEHTKDFLYRVGNGNTVKLGSLFEVSRAGENAVVSSKVNIAVYSADSQTSVAGSGSGLVSGSTAKCTYTKNGSDWTQSTLKFTGEGPVEIVISESNGWEYSLYVEVVEANNATTAVSASSTNIVLLNDVSTNGQMTITKTLYGNGFEYRDTRNNPSGTAGFINMYSGGTADNVRFIGYEPEEAVPMGVNNPGFAPAIKITGNANIYNCYCSGGKYAIQITDTGKVLIKNTTVDGGAVGNIGISGATVTLENVTTTVSTRGGVRGLGVHVTTLAGVKINIRGYLHQYNWLTRDDVPSDYDSFVNDLFSNSTYAYTYNSTKYVNFGLFFLSNAVNMSASQVQQVISDTTGNSYGYIEKTNAGHTGTLYAQKASSATPSFLTPPEYVADQSSKQPTLVFDFTNKNYIEMVSGDNNYCYYDSATDKVRISFDKTDSSSNFVWDTDILTISKYGQPIDYTVSMNNTDYTDSSVTFTESGDYEVVYTYTDIRDYDKNVNASSVTYNKVLNISVTAVEPDNPIHYALFSYVGNWANPAKKVIINNNTYVMPDVTSTSSNIGSTTVGGQTVYFPIVTVGPTSSNGNTAYSSGKGYYFAPVFNALNITDYNQDTGATLYTYNSSTTTWPRGKSASNGPDSNYFGYADGAAFANKPYARSMDSQYYGFGKNNNGLCYTSNQIEKDNAASEHLVQYHYVSTDGTTYYYYIKYSFTAMSYSCVAEGTLVTMADGTKKPVEQVNQGDMVMTWSFWNGCYEAQPVTIKWYHGTQNWEVLTLNFSDGTSVRTINQHGFFDVDENTYAYIEPDNVEDYIGHRFIKQNPDGTNETVVLTDYTLEEENVGCYSLQTAYNDNFMVEDMLSITGEDYEGRFEYFDIGDGMKYDEIKMQADIDRYGLYSYEEFSDYLTPMQFELFNGKYFKVLVGKGVMSYDDILEIIRNNL